MKGEWGIGIGKKTAEKVVEGASSVASAASEADKVSLVEKGLEFLIGGVKVVMTYLVNNNEVFIVVAMIGMIIVITGHKELGKKVTGGSIIGFIIAKVVSEWP